LNEDREYWIGLPDSYHDKNSSHKNYPVIVVLDGNIHFRSIYGMVNYMSSESYPNRKIPEMIVVAIQNIDRRRDLTQIKSLLLERIILEVETVFLVFWQLMPTCKKIQSSIHLLQLTQVLVPRIQKQWTKS
jgi:enterochelin esterase-like enzyme